MNIEQIINNWDPYSLFPFAPKDEYSEEITKIQNYISINHDIDSLTKYLEKIFHVDIIFEEEKKYFVKIANKILDSVG